MPASVRYLVDDLDLALAFYVERLGFVPGERMGPFAIVRRGDLDLWLSGPATSARKPTHDGSIPVAGGWNRIVVEVERLDDVLDSLRAGGAIIRSEIVAGPGGRQALVEDPSGNPVEIFEPRR